jgi:hypothetical protein
VSRPHGRFSNRPCTGLLFALLALSLSITRAQQPAFRAGVDVVSLDVTVLDRNRRPVRGLTAADFTVLEGGRPRPIVAFAEVALPQASIDSTAPAPWLRDAARDVVSNDPNEGRLVVIMFDHTISERRDPRAGSGRVAHRLLCRSPQRRHERQSPRRPAQRAPEPADPGGADRRPRGVVRQRGGEGRSRHLRGERQLLPDRIRGGCSTGWSEPARLSPVDVRVGGRDVSVQRRSGYYLPSAAIAGAATVAAPGLSPLELALQGQLPKTEIPLRVAIAPFRLPGSVDPTLAIALNLNPDPPLAGRVEAITTAYDTHGNALGTQRLSVDLPESAGAVGPREDELLSRIELRPGRYEIRLAAREERSGRTGSVYTFVDVPRLPQGRAVVVGCGDTGVTGPSSAGVRGAAIAVADRAHRAELRDEQRRACLRAGLSTGVRETQAGHGPCPHPGRVESPRVRSNDGAASRAVHGRRRRLFAGSATHAACARGRIC